MTSLRTSANQALAVAEVACEHIQVRGPAVGLPEQYRQFEFWAERDVVWTPQTRLRRIIGERQLRYEVFNDYPLLPGPRRGRSADLVIRDSQTREVLVAAEFKYEPSHRRAEILAQPGKLPCSGAAWPKTRPGYASSSRPEPPAWQWPHSSTKAGTSGTAPRTQGQPGSIGTAQRPAACHDQSHGQSGLQADVLPGFPPQPAAQDSPQSRAAGSMRQPRLSC